MGGRFALASDVAPTRPTPNVFGLWGHPTPRGGLRPCTPAEARGHVIELIYPGVALSLC
ncbi:MAG: hypothetical protein C1O27_001610 [Chloroflexi bacterium]|nr:MAG: hypothetical protein C1O27_001610 [Chloroflexota bacterium]